MASKVLLFFVLCYTLSVVTCDCPNGFVRHDDSCYKVVRIKATWAEATVYCHAFGSEMVSLETQKENIFLTGMLKNLADSFDPKKFWLGATDMAEEGSWAWAKSGQPLTVSNWQVTPWQNGNPDNGGNDANEHCMDLREDHHWQWGDNNCDEHYYFVCERPLFSTGNIFG